MTTAYLVFQDNLDSYDLKGVFSTREKAEQFINKANVVHASIAEVGLDPDEYSEYMHDPGQSYYDGRYH